MRGIGGGRRVISGEAESAFGTGTGCGWLHRLGTLQVVGTLAVMGCNEGAGITASGSSAAEITLAVDSIVIRRNGGRQVALQVTSPPGGTRLAVAGIGDGIMVAFSQATLPAGSAQSVLAVSVTSAAPVGVSTVRINASSSDGKVLASAALHVVVLEPQQDCPSCPFTVGGSNVVSGLVLQRSDSGTRPLGGATVWAWVEGTAHGYSRSTVANGNGEYRLERLEDARIYLMGWTGGYDQPCASFVDVKKSSATANLEVVWPSDAKVDTNPEAPALMGVVYEVTAAGRKPLAGVRLYFDRWMDMIVATATTDELGRYSMCRLPTSDALVWATKGGYVLTERPVTVSGVMQMDIEMKRQ